MTLSYKSYIITGTVEELKQFVDLMENKTIISNTPQGLNANENKIPSGTIHVFDPKTGTFVEGKIKNVPDGVTNKCNYPNNVCENH